MEPQATSGNLKRVFDIVVNRRSGTVIRETEARVREELERIYGDQCPVTFVDPADFGGAVRKWVLEHSGDGHTLVIGGGDGTILSAAAEVMGTDITLGVLPLGTHNLFARSLGYDADYRAAARQMKDSRRVEKIDVGTVNENYFLYGMLMDKNCVSFFEGREHVRDGKIVESARKFWDMVSGLLWREEEIIRIAGEGLPVAEFEEKGRLFAIVNNAFKPQPTPLAPGVSPKTVIENSFAKGEAGSGLLSFYSCTAGLANAVPVLHHIWKGTWEGHPSVHTLKAPSFTISQADGDTDEITVIVDGEIRKMRYPVHVGVLPRALSMLRPEV